MLYLDDSLTTEELREAAAEQRATRPTAIRNMCEHITQVEAAMRDLYPAGYDKLAPPF